MKVRFPVQSCFVSTDYDETYGILYEMQARLLNIQNCNKVNNLADTYAESELCTNSTEVYRTFRIFN